MSPDGRHSFFDLDPTWYQYLASDRKGRQRMCEQAVEIESIVVCIALIAGIVLGIVALCKGWI